MSRARNLGNLGNENLISGDTANLRVGINSTLPTTKLDVDGNITATAFFGDGSNLEGVASAGLGTALSDDGAGSVIYFTNTTLGIGSTVVVDPPSTTKIAYTQYSDISLDENVDFIVEDGDDFVPDVLGLSTEGISELTGIGGRIRAGSFTDKAGTGAPKLTFGAEVPVGVAVTGAGGINVAGFATAGGFVGNLTGNTSGTAGGLTGTPDITVRNITGVAATFTGVLTYEDVTNVDSIGLVTARSGIQFGAAGVGGTIRANGDTTLAGVVTATKFKGDGSELTGVVSGIELFQAGSSVGTSLTAVNFASGATLTTGSSGFSTVTIAAGITTTAGTASGIVTTLLLNSAQDHKLTATGVCTVTVSGGSEGDSHTLRIINSSTATVGFSTYFLFPSGSAPALPTADGAISLVSFTVNRVGAAGTQLLAGVAGNFS